MLLCQPYLSDNQSRRGVVLLVVIVMLALFAAVGITFVFYAEACSAASTSQRQSLVEVAPDMDPEMAFALFLDQLLFDVRDDGAGLYSALRGHSLLRNMYGLNYEYNGSTLVLNNNTVPFNGTGRQHYQVTLGTDPATGQPLTEDNYKLVNYTYFPGFAIRDPERNGTRQNPSVPRTSATNPYTESFNAPYTYPDLNSMYLGAIDGNGNVLMPSFHRPWLFGSDDPTNPHWKDAIGKYLTLRPRTFDNSPDFPYPVNGGDVRNLPGAGSNDSYWLNLNAPVMRLPDGRKYIALFAPLIIDLDGKVNLNVHGNIKQTTTNAGGTTTTRNGSNEGWGPWEVNPKQVLFSTLSTTEWQNIFKGAQSSVNASAFQVVGRYGPDLVPESPALTADPGRNDHYYAQTDPDGAPVYPPATDTNPGTILLPGSNALAPANSLFPFFSLRYGNGSNAERKFHPSLYNPQAPRYVGPFPTPNPTSLLYDRSFRVSNLEKLYRFGSTGDEALNSELLQLLPNNLVNDPANSARIRRLVTLLSANLRQPGITPWAWKAPGVSAYGSTNGPLMFPYGPQLFFPQPGQTVSTFDPQSTSDFGADWRFNGANTNLAKVLTKVNLRRVLTQYPLYVAPPVGTQSESTYQTRFDSATQGGGGGPPTPDATAQQFLRAQADRQQLADDIYRRLLIVTALPAPLNPAAPTDPELAPRRWLAQLAVNIVDFIDEDDIITPFNFYTAADGPPTDGINAMYDPPVKDSNGNVVYQPEIPKYWVFGTEMPRLLLNETLIEKQLLPGPAGLYQNSVWVELLNPLAFPASGQTGHIWQTQDNFPVQLCVNPSAATLPAGSNTWIGGNFPNGFAPYKVVVTDTLWGLNNSLNNNVVGKPNYYPQSNGKNTVAETKDSDFDTTQQAKAISGNNPPPPQPPLPAAYQQTAPGTAYVPPAGFVVGGQAQSGYFLVGPNALDKNQTIGGPAGKNTVPNGTPIMKTATNMVYYNTVTAGGVPGPVDDRTGVTVLLRRLANPHLPWNNDPTTPFYNPYITIDYLQNVPANNTAQLTYSSRSKRQPFAGFTIVANAPSAALNSPVVDTQQTVVGTNHTFGSQNNPGPQSGKYTWLAHLDRAPISPIELLDVSAFQPHQLTQQFINTPGDDTIPASKFQHYAPWFDQLSPGGQLTIPPANKSARLYRLFEFLECSLSNGWATSAPSNRSVGQMNINTIFDKETFRALCDPRNPPTPPNTGLNNPVYFTTTDVDAMFIQLLSSRSPGLVPPTTPPPPTFVPQLGSVGIQGATDRPFLSLATGSSQSGPTITLPPPPPGGTTYPNQYPNGQGIADTLFRADSTGNKLLFQLNAANAPHPYLQNQLLSKIFNNVTTRSNTFAVFLTVGFFAVDDSSGTVKLGAEIGKDQNRQIRHRMFAVIDRTQLQTIFPVANTTNPIIFKEQLVTNPPAVGAGTGTVTPVVQSPAGSGNYVSALNSTASQGTLQGNAWQIVPGMVLTVISSKNGTPLAETVVVQSVDTTKNTFTANFTISHTVDTTTTPTIYPRIFAVGNPGPRQQIPFNPHNSSLIAHFSIID